MQYNSTLVYFSVLYNQPRSLHRFIKRWSEYPRLINGCDSFPRRISTFHLHFSISHFISALFFHTLFPHYNAWWRHFPAMRYYCRRSGSTRSTHSTNKFIAQQITHLLCRSQKIQLLPTTTQPRSINPLTLSFQLKTLHTSTVKFYILNVWYYNNRVLQPRRFMSEWMSKCMSACYVW